MDHVPFVAGQPQKKVLRPVINTVNPRKGFSCANQLSSVHPATDGHTAALNLPAEG